MKKSRYAGGFTLIEIIFATVIIGVIGFILTSFLMNSARSLSWSIDKSLITKDFREFTMQITRDAYNANVAYLYTSFLENDCDTPGDRREIGLSGDCLILIQAEPHPDVNSPRFYRRIVVYYRQPDPTGLGQLLRTERLFGEPLNPTNFEVDGEIEPFEDFLNRERNFFSDPEIVIESTRGLANRQLFNRLSNGTFLITGEIFSGTNESRITNTYNLTISTRG